MYVNICRLTCVKLRIRLENFKEVFARVWFNIAMTSDRPSFFSVEIDEIYWLSQLLWKNVWHGWSRGQPQTGLSSTTKGAWERGWVGDSVAPESVDRRFKPRWNPEFFSLLYAIAKIAFITVTIIASLDFISTVQYMIYFICYRNFKWEDGGTNDGIDFFEGGE